MKNVFFKSNFFDKLQILKNFLINQNLKYCPPLQHCDSDATNKSKKKSKDRERLYSFSV